MPVGSERVLEHDCVYKKSGGTERRQSKLYLQLSTLLASSLKKVTYCFHFTRVRFLQDFITIRYYFLYDSSFLLLCFFQEHCQPPKSSRVPEATYNFSMAEIHLVLEIVLFPAPTLVQNSVLPIWLNLENALLKTGEGYTPLHG